MGSSSKPLFSWLHLSDIHFGHGNATERAHRNLVLNRLLRDVHKAEKWGAPPPEAVFVTGDIGFSGDISTRQEYMQASAWLWDLAYKLKLKPEKIYLVPGNHDVARVTPADSRTLELLQKLRTGEQQLDDSLDEADARDLLVGRMKHYREFATQFFPRADSGALQETLCWFQSLEVQEGLRLRLVGLNTALLANDDYDRGHLRLGLHQLSRAFSQDAGTDELFIALAHHPPNWLGDKDKIEPWLKNQVHIFLCGHIHEQKSVSIQPSGGQQFVQVASGALHEVSANGKTPARFAFNFGAVLPGPHGKLQLRIWPFIWTKHHEFRPDSEHLREPLEYYAPHDLEVPNPVGVPLLQGPGTQGRDVTQVIHQGDPGATVEPGVTHLANSISATSRSQPTTHREAVQSISVAPGRKNTNQLALNENSLRDTRDFLRDSNTFLVDTYPRSQHPQFFSEVERLISTSKTITLIAIGLNILWQKHILDVLIRRARSGESKVVICVGNPYSSHVKNRWIEESQLQLPRGKQGAKVNIQGFLDQISKAGNPENIQVRLFEHYPTFATLIFDDHIFFYPYAYQLVGNSSPIFHLRDNGSDETKFFLENANRTINHSVPAKDVMSARANRRYRSNDWVSVAIYIVPEKESPFYQFGSSVLGYDVRAKSLVPVNSQALNELRKYVGKAEEFGFHATLADALFYASEKDLERVKAEVRDLCGDLKPFTLSNFRLTNQFREGDDLVVLCDDYSGTIELLHHELIGRVYSHAISSKYRTERTHNSVSPEKRVRAELMIDWYGAPYIIRDFALHFTLCSELPADSNERSSVLAKAQELFDAQVKKDRVLVDEICVMVRQGSERHWRICESYPLSKA